MGSKQGVLKIAAKRIGISFEEYLEKRSQGLKWCTKGKHWQSLSEFCSDSSRGDGLKSTCRSCDYTRLRKGPTKHERELKKEKGLAWCRGCRAWLPIENVHRGACRQCHNREARERYARDEEFRNRRRQRSAAYQRGVEPVPPEGRDVLMEDFQGLCAYCCAPADTWDHIIPVSDGGQTTPGNIVPACTSCNSSKRAKDVADWLDERDIKDIPAYMIESLCHSAPWNIERLSPPLSLRFTRAALSSNTCRRLQSWR